MSSTPTSRPFLFTGLALAALIGCADKTNRSSSPAEPTKSSPGGEQAGGDGSQGSDTTGNNEPAVELSAEPQIDLVANRHRWHLFSAGLVIPLASEGLLKYTNEYSRPWGEVVEHAGDRGRTLSNRQGTLLFHWFDDATDAVLYLRAAGLAAGQRATLVLNDKTVGTATLEPGWSTARVEIGSGILRRGENRLRIHLKSRGNAAGKNSYGLFHSLEIAPAGAEVTATPELAAAGSHSAGGRELPSLRGFSRLIQLVEVPSTGWLDVSTAGAAGTVFEVRATAVDGTSSDLLTATAAGDSWQHHQVDLAALAGKLIALELRIKGDLAAAAWGQPRIALAAADSAPRPAPAKNLILLVVDALRSDKMPLYQSVYGDGHAVRMPRIAAEAAKGSIVMLHNQAASPSSPPSHGSIQTGMIPRVHGVDGDKGKIKPGTPTISTQMVDAGIAAGYFGNNPFGMARLREPGRWTAFHQPGMEGNSNDCTALMQLMLEFAGQQSSAGKRFFISSLPYETHTPYRYHEGITEHYYDGPFGPPLGKSVDGDVLGALSAGKMTLNESQWKHLKGLYNGEAEYMDQCFGALVDGLTELGIRDDTVIVLTSDHGEGMFEHQKMGHAFGHYRELGDVPFVIFWPALADKVVELETVTSHRDIAPTLLDLMGVEPDSRVQGQTILPMILRRGPWTPRVVSLEYGRSYSLRSRDYKLIVDYNGGQEAYDLSKDPWEHADLLDQGGLSVRYLRDMVGFFLAYRADWRTRDWGALNNHGPGFLAHVKER